MGWQLVNGSGGRCSSGRVQMEGAQLWGRAWFPTTPCVDTGTSLKLSGGLDFSLLCNGHDDTVARIYAQSKFNSKGEEPDMSRSAPRLEELREWCPPLNAEDPGGSLWLTGLSSKSLFCQDPIGSCALFVYLSFWIMCFKAAIPNLFGTTNQFHGRQFFHSPRLQGMVSG